MEEPRADDGREEINVPGIDFWPVESAASHVAVIIIVAVPTEEVIVAEVARFDVVSKRAALRVENNLHHIADSAETLVANLRNFVINALRDDPEEGSLKLAEVAGHKFMAVVFANKSNALGGSHERGVAAMLAHLLQLLRQRWPNAERLR